MNRTIGCALLLSLACAAPPSEAKPPAAGKKVKISGVGDAKPFEVTLPAGFKHKVAAADEAHAPSATLTGANVKVTIEQPQSGALTFAQQKASTTKSDDKAVIEVATDEGADGWTLIYKNGPDFGKMSDKYTAIVSRPALAVYCAAYGVDTRKQADDAVAICHTLRAP